MDSPASSQELRASQTSLHFSDSGSDKENVTVRPNNKPHTSLSTNVPGNTSSSEDEDNNDGSAYERVRRQLLGKLDNNGSVTGTTGRAVSPLKVPASPSSVALSRVAGAPIGRMARRMQSLFGGDSEDELQGNGVFSQTPNDQQAAQQSLADPASSEDDLATPRSSQRNTETGPAQHRSTSQASSQPSHDSLFRSPAQPNLADSDDELPPVPSRLQALVARKREERLAKERAAEETRQQSESDDMPEQVRRPAKKVRKQPTVAPVVSDGPSGEEEGDEALTQHNRPTRKASKKAIEEMNRETQRMQRNMQLTHQAKTKTSFSTSDLFKKFNFRQAKVQHQVEHPTEEGQAVSASASSDIEHAGAVDTPPSSPPSLTDEATKSTTERVHTESTIQPAADSDSDGPSLQQAFQAARKQLVSEPQAPKPKISVREFMKRAGKQRSAKPSDDDLVLIKPKATGGIAVLDRVSPVKVRESHAVHALHTLAHMNEHDMKPRKGTRKSMAPTELSAHLRQLARKQAMAERDEKIQALKDKGIYVQTAEERERDQLQLENMLDRARQEAQELAQREKDTAKREGRELENDFPDSDEDEDYVASADEENIQLSGSEDEGSHADNEDSEDEGEASERDNIDGQVSKDDFFDDAASESGVDEEAEIEAVPNDQDLNEEHHTEESSHATPARPKVVRRNRKTLVDSDDEEDVPANMAVVNTPTQGRPTPKTPKSALAAAFGFGQAQEAGPGLSQMFAGTMAESQDDEDFRHAAMDSQQDSLAFLRGLAPSSIPNFRGIDSPVMARDSQDVIVQNSQAGETQFTATAVQGPGLDDVHFETPTQMQYPETQVTASQLPDATQDEGFQTAFSPPTRPLGGAPNPSTTTVDTVLLGSPTLTESPVFKRKGRLQRRQQDAQERIEEAGSADEDASFEISANVFDVMRKAAATKPAAEADFDRKKSDAKGMVDEQAEESEDEYAGLGGASDDESTGELDAETKAALIDDTTKEKLNERQVAAFFADKERADDEKRVEKLFKDIANGGLRRKRGADLELWDSDDEDEVAKRKRAAKQREFAKMRRALLADEKLGKIAENPKQAAFLQAIEDREGDDEVFFLDAPEELPEEESQPQIAAEEPEDSTTGEGSGGLKRKRAEEAGEDDIDGTLTRPSNGPAPKTRRTGRFTKPTTLLDIRATLSELIGEPTPSQHLSDAEEEHEQRLEEDEDEDTVLDSQPLEHSISRSASPAVFELNNESPAPRTHPRRTPASTVRTAVIDRIAMKRSRSSSLAAKAASAATTSRQAFFSASVTGAGSFKVPSLLRRATTNASNTSDTSHSDTVGALSVNTGGMGKEVIKVGGSKKSSVNYYVREKERRAKVEEVERTRDEGRKRIGLRRRKEVGVGLGGRVGGGGFED